MLNGGNGNAVNGNSDTAGTSCDTVGNTCAGSGGGAVWTLFGSLAVQTITNVTWFGNSLSAMGNGGSGNGQNGQAQGSDVGGSSLWTFFNAGSTTLPTVFVALLRAI